MYSVYVHEVLIHTTKTFSVRIYHYCCIHHKISGYTDTKTFVVEVFNNLYNITVADVHMKSYYDCWTTLVLMN